MTGIRAKARVETTAEIMRLARRQIADKGATDLSLREIAREMGLASSALYRYFDSRDQLLTALIIESYDAIGSIVEEADSACDRNDFHGRWMAMCIAVRKWALDHPSDYGLIFGTPIPGYDAPSDTVEPALRYTSALLRLLIDADANGCRPHIDTPETRGLAKEYKHVRKSLANQLPDEMLLAGLTAWAAIFGALSFEMFGHVDTVFVQPGIHFKALVDMLGEQLLGLS